jgi:hypothetical protein
VASLRIAMREVATRDFVRSELRALLEELDERGTLQGSHSDARPIETTATGTGTEPSTASPARAGSEDERPSVATSG